MSAITRRILLLAFVLALAAPAGATNYLWTPGNGTIGNDLNDLDHYKYYQWGINGSGANLASSVRTQLLSGYQITSAKLTFTNIYDWVNESGDQLFVHLLDNPSAGTTEFTDNQGGGDNFAGQGVLIGTPWSDPLGGSPRNFNLVYDLVSLNLTTTLTNYILNNNSPSYFGFGFDPDCHYFNDGVKFEITTTLIPHDPTVPEPATIALLGMGLSGFGMLRRRKRATAA